MNPRTTIRTTLVLSNYYMQGTVQAINTEDAAVNKADVVFPLVELTV